MKFYLNNHCDYEQNQQASVIPWSIWWWVFDYCSSADELARTQCPVASQSRLHRNENPIKAYLCVLFGHPDSAAQALLDAADRMDVSRMTVCLAALYAQRTDLLKLVENDLLPDFRCERISQDDVCNALFWAGIHQQSFLFNQVLDLVSPHFSGLKNDKKTHRSAFDHAVKQGHLDIVDRIVELVPDLDYLLDQSSRRWGKCPQPVFNRLIELTLSSSRQPFDILAQNQFYAVGKAVEDKNLESLNRLLALVPDDRQRTLMVTGGECPYQFFMGAAYPGGLEIFKRLLSAISVDFEAHRTAVFELCVGRALYELSMSNDLAFLDYFIEQVPERLIRRLQDSDCFDIDNAAVRGSVEVLGRLIALSPQWLEAQQKSQYRTFSGTYGPKVIRRFLELAPDHVDDMLTVSKYKAIVAAYRYYNQDRDLLAHITSLASHPRHRAALNNPFFLEKVRQWYQEFDCYKHSRDKSSFSKTVTGIPTGNRVYCFKYNEAKRNILGSFIARHLLTRDEPATDRELKFLLRIPAIAVSLHGSLDPEQCAPRHGNILRESAFVAELMAYRERRSADPRGEYYSFFALLWGGYEPSRSATLRAIDTLIYYIQEEIFETAHLPEATKNGELSDIVNRFVILQSNAATSRHVV